MRFIKITRARDMLSSLVDSGQVSVITRNGEPVSVLLDFNLYRALRTVRILADDPARLAEIFEGHEKVQEGDLSGFEEIPVEEPETESAGSGVAATEV